MLTTEEINEFKKILEYKRKNLLIELQKIAIINEDGTWVAKYEDIARDKEVNANEVEEFTNREAVVNTLNKDLKKVESALKRIADGTYGKCITCGKEILKERLEIFPEAEQCRECANIKK